MAWVYILKLSNGNYYIGSTNNLAQRIFAHEHGQSPFTSRFLPAYLVFSQEFPTITEAITIERKLKKFKNRKIIQKIIKGGVITLRW